MVQRFFDVTIRMVQRFFDVTIHMVQRFIDVTIHLRKQVWQNLLNYRTHMHLSLSDDL